MRQTRSARINVAAGVAAKQDGATGLLGWSAVLLILLVVGRVIDFVPGMEGLPLVKVAVVLALVALVTDKSSRYTQAGWKTPLAKIGLALAVLAALSLLFSIWKSQTLQEITGQEVLLVVLFLVVARVATSWRMTLLVIQTMALCGAILAVVAALSYSGGRAAVHSWYDTNDLAYVLVTLLPITATVMRMATGWKKWFWRLQLALFVYVIIITGSRGGAIALACVALLYLLVGDMPFVRKNVGAAVVKSLAAVAAIAVLLAVAWPHLPAETRERLQSIGDLGSDYNMEKGNTDSRTDIWKRGLGELARRPIGFGLGTYPAVDGRTGGVYHTAHNSVVLALVELGVVGGLLYLWLYRAAWVLLGRVMRAVPGEDDPDYGTARDRAILAASLRIALIGNFAAGFFLSMTYSFILWTLWALISGFTAEQMGGPAAVRIRSKRPESVPRVPRALRSAARVKRGTVADR